MNVPKDLKKGLGGRGKSNTRKENKNEPLNWKAWTEQPGHPSLRGKCLTGDVHQPRVGNKRTQGKKAKAKIDPGLFVVKTDVTGRAFEKKEKQDRGVNKVKEGESMKRTSGDKKLDCKKKKPGTVGK